MPKAGIGRAAGRAKKNKITANPRSSKVFTMVRSWVRFASGGVALFRSASRLVKDEVGCVMRSL